MSASGRPSQSGFSRRGALVSALGAASVAACASAKTPPVAHAAAGGMIASQRGVPMNRFAVNLETWWRGLPLLERIDQAARAGFTTAEMWGLSEGERDPATLKRLSSDAGLYIAHCTVSVPKLVSASVREFRDEVSASLDKITALGARYGTIVGHKNVDGMTKADMLSAYQDRLADAAPLFEAAGVVATIEPFNPFNHPGFFLYGADDAVRICREIGSPNMKINWDLFHMQRHEGNLVTRLREGIDQCGLLQIADSPDRREPGTGELDYSYIIGEAFKLGFAGHLGLECFPDKGEESVAVERVRTMAASIAP